MSLDRVSSPNSLSRPRCSGSRSHSGRLSGLPSWLSLFLISLLPAAVSAAPHSGTDGVRRRDNSSSNSSTSISMNVWLPILVVTMVFLLVSLCTCVRRCAANQAATSSANGNQAGSTPASTNATSTTRNRRRPQRTPSQISTRSLPPYMKEPGDHELVLSRAPEEGEDDQAPHQPMPTLAEDDEERLGMHNGTFDIALDGMESMDTMPDSSTATLIGRLSASLSRPPNLHHPTMPRNHQRTGDGHSLDSVGSEAELLATHRRSISVENPRDSRGEAPPYTELAATTTTINDPDPSSNPAVPPSSHTADPATGRARPRFSFLTRNPFSSHNGTSNASSNANPTPTMRADSPASHTRSGSALTRFSSHESHESHHSRTISRNNNLSRGHNRSNSSLFRAFHSQSPGPQAASSTISLDNISAPLTHTVTRAEFRAPKGGLLTPEQVKLITSRDALERFGMPYGPDAIAAFSLSREMPPGFESVAGEHLEQAGGSGTSGVAVDTTTETADISALQRSTSLHATADELEDQAQTVQVNGTGVDEARTAQPITPETARPSSLSGSLDHRP